MTSMTETIDVETDPMTAFSIFTDEFDQWWGRGPIDAYDSWRLVERRIVVVSPRFDGYVETVGPVTTGTHVKKGDVLAKVFGQDVLNEAARLLIEQNDGTRDGEAFTPSGFKGASGVAVGATRRLQNLGVPEAFMQQVKRERRVPDTFEYRSPIDGVILERNWSDGQGFKAGDVGFRIADHSQVWMMADVAEGDQP